MKFFDFVEKVESECVNDEKDISVIDLDKIPDSDDDVVELVDLVTPEKKPARHFKKRILENYIDETKENDIFEMAGKIILYQFSNLFFKKCILIYYF